LDDHTSPPLKSTPLDGLHRARGAKMVPFAGYSMPVNYALGVLKEHLHTRTAAGLFDVSHMGQAELIGSDAARALEMLVPGDIQGLAPGHVRYTLLTTPEGGIIDDLMVTRVAESADRLFLIVNAACKDGDFAHIESLLKGRATLARHDDAALLALQGPQAAAVLARFIPEAATMPFMTSRAAKFDGGPEGMPKGVSVRLFRSGYTGEDGYEISVPAAGAVSVAERLLGQAEVQLIGLGARDSLRLEAGLCLYGSDIDLTTTPVEAALSWVIGKRRREAGDFPGATRILAQLKDGPSRRRVGIRPLGRAPARAHTEVRDANGRKIGEITSGGFGPSVNGPIAMGYVESAFAAVGTPLTLIVRGQGQPAEVAPLPFVPHRYAKKP
jgi:aminomethyltransferase